MVRPQQLLPLPFQEVPDPMSVSPLRRSRLVALLTVALTCATAWVGGSAGTAAAQSSTSKIPAGTVLNVGDQEQTLETLFQASGVLKGAKYKVNFVEFDSGPLVDAGFAAHKIDLGSMGDLPASLAAKSGLPVKAIAVDLPIGASEFLLAQPGITSIAQLKGKPVAYTTGTSEQAFALRALASAGLGQKDVRQVNVALQQLGTVLESGAADASVVSVEQKIDYQATHPSAKVLADVDTVTPPSYGYLLGTTAALSEPAEDAAVKDFTARLLKANEWRNRHQAGGCRTTTSRSSTRRRRRPGRSWRPAAPTATSRSPPRCGPPCRRWSGCWRRTGSPRATRSPPSSAPPHLTPTTPS